MEYFLYKDKFQKPILRDLINSKIIAAPIRYIPYPHSIYRDVFPIELYHQLTECLPETNHYTFSNCSYPQRGFIFLGCNQSFQLDYPEIYQTLLLSYNHQPNIYQPQPSIIWKPVIDWLLADSTLELWLNRYRTFIQDRFDLQEMKFYQRTTLCRDLPGYTIPPHTDTPRKILTIIFYLPSYFVSDLTSPISNNQFGTQILTDLQHRNHPPRQWDSQHQKDWSGFSIHTNIQYAPNTAMDFLVGPRSWHGVQPFTGTGTRDTIQVAIYGFSEKTGPSLG